MSKRISADIAIIARVGKFADAYAVQYNPNDPVKYRHSVLPAL
jgi:hypothetical protein